MIIRARSYGYVLAIAVLSLVLVWAGITWQQLRNLYRSFDAVHADAFHLSEHIEARVLELNENTLRFDLRRLPVDWAAFQNTSGQLQEYIRDHKPTVTTPEERELMGQIELGFEVYLSRVARLIDERAQAGATTLPQTMLESVGYESKPVLDLCKRMKKAELEAQTEFRQASRRELFRLQELLAVQMGLLVILVGTGGVAVYRGVIGPLRIELGESRARAARHEKLASLGTLAAGVAHEIRNPLTAINVRLHSLKKNLVPNSSEHEDALVIRHEIQRLERIVQEFLRFARPGDPKLLVVSADSLLARMQSLFGPQLEKASIQLKLESVPDVWVRVDPHQIEQVLINLIQNSAESMERGGRITLRARSGTARLRGQARSIVMLDVSDTGKGIPPEVRKRIYDPFFTTKEEGTGLGLAIASRIVEMHGGALECRSEANRGTTFSILLPHAKPEENDEP